MTQLICLIYLKHILKLIKKLTYIKFHTAEQNKAKSCCLMVQFSKDKRFTIYQMDMEFNSIYVEITTMVTLKMA